MRFSSSALRVAIIVACPLYFFGDAKAQPGIWPSCVTEANLSEFDERFVQWAFNPSQSLNTLVKRDSGIGALHSIFATFGFSNLPLDKWEVRSFYGHSSAPAVGFANLPALSRQSVDEVLVAAADSKERAHSRLGGVLGDALTKLARGPGREVGVLAVVNGSALGDDGGLPYLESRLATLGPADATDRFGQHTDCKITRFRIGERPGSTLVLVDETVTERVMSCVAAGFFAHHGFSNPVEVHAFDELILQSSETKNWTLNLSYAGMFSRMYGNGDQREGLDRGATICEVTDTLGE